MKAKEILESINMSMSKDQIMALVKEASADMVLLDAHQVAKQLGATYSTVRNWGNVRDIGVKMSQGKTCVRIYFPSDVEKIRTLLKNKRKYKLRRVVNAFFSCDTTRSGSKQQSALNVVFLDCGHIEEVVYWPYRNHYQSGDKCRCYSCPLSRPTMTPEEWKKEFFCNTHESYEKG